ncbi:MAG: agl cluster protein AglQ [Nitrospiraceae bacterium]|nr:MAG: agl cluster protein AglQ [Nitrospiraceae bacterium]
MLLSDIILQSCEAALQMQRDDGSFLPGCNGPYNDPENPVRNTAHWLITLLKAYEISNEPKFRDSAYRAAQYILLPKLRPMNATFFCRRNPEKDFCNGLMGQAWIIEALVIAGIILEDNRSLELARNVFALHPFDYKAGLWRRVNVDGSYNSFDMTFNHQLWFAAIGSLLDNSSSDTVKSIISRFLDRVSESHLKIDRSGRIRHMISEPSALLKKISDAIYMLRRMHRLHEANNKMAIKEIGYHAFNMYAFSLLKNYMPGHHLWRSAKFLTALEFINKDEFINGLDNNIFAYPYNPAGFEVALTIQEFSPVLSFSKSAEWWVEQQLQRCYSFEDRMMSKLTEDKETLSARLYEATRLKEMKLQLT